MRNESLDTAIGSPFKRHRASVQGLDSGILSALSSGANDSYPPSALAAGHHDDSLYAGSASDEPKVAAKGQDSDEEL